LLFQTLDDKKDCVGVYVDGELIHDTIPTGLSQTWDYSTFLQDTDIEYAKLYCGGMSLDQVCPPHLRTQWEGVRDKLKAYYRSFGFAKVSLDENCFFDLVPRQFLLDYCEVKNKITQHVFDSYEKPDNYDFIKQLRVTLDDIRYNELTLNMEGIRPIYHKASTRKFVKNLQKYSSHCRYNIWGTKTGRLTNVPGSFPILTLDKQYRSVVKPNNDWFLELDYNAAELRVALALAGQEQPDIDIHQWNIENIFGDIDRQEAKRRIFAWLYGRKNVTGTLGINDGSVEKLLEETYRRERIISSHWTGTHVSTRFGRTIPSDHHHSLSYIIQSSCVDVTLRRLIEVHNHLRNYRSRIAFTLHDSIVIDLAYGERKMIPELINLFSQTEFGTFKVNTKVGLDFGNMTDLILKK
tara:strand:+ start:7736 stop:8959 length:1224 start_codon:yes stop_codon:yes gene_type:complete